MMSPLSARSTDNSAQADADYMLGQTGETVVYIFPTGHALMNRDTDNASAILMEHQGTTAPPEPQTPTADDQIPEPSPGESTSIVDLLADGKLTVAQIQVARYDQSVTGMSLAEALALRGWL